LTHFAKKVRIIDCIVDRNSWFEIKPRFAPMMITGLARMNGHPVGIIANQPRVFAGAITAKAGQKERHFVDLCNAYHIPLIFLVDTPGVMTGPTSEKEGALRFGLAVAYALAWAEVPKVSAAFDIQSTDFAKRSEFLALHVLRNFRPAVFLMPFNILYGSPIIELGELLIVFSH
jgi:hypothetical protein